ncbi:hypothetical protein EV426DRAFT_422414 [Tirmania nivea]|nr:hypothetical protein EV426DRAFT_422414 [Tirmania nivea]
MQERSNIIRVSFHDEHFPCVGEGQHMHVCLMILYVWNALGSIMEFDMVMTMTTLPNQTSQCMIPIEPGFGVGLPTCEFLIGMPVTLSGCLPGYFYGTTYKRRIDKVLKLVGTNTGGDRKTKVVLK